MNKKNNVSDIHDDEIVIAARSVNEAADKASKSLAAKTARKIGDASNAARNIYGFAKAFIPSRTSFVIVQTKGDGCYTCRIASCISVFGRSKFMDIAPNALVDIAFGEMRKEDVRIVRNGVRQFDLIDNGTGEVLCSAVAC